ncbi:helix-turn-helix domain-containing protein [Spiractinospora alimapuensis]|uniref:helix-turn-helix domain-containing protein n=1 Tax=Spiractinospora alimapuensis TaxID=2820884 RepID=UPI001F257DF3|nr:helix-turn-helix transcriptional regulator [Spiractinospora alimapuensis]QVQ53285.1 helix-turn-helix domain-containing protein [Spiractinospora alimapuensis]
MSAPYSPSIRRRRLSAELRKLRSQSELTLQEASKQAGIGKSNLSKIEQAESKTVPTKTLDMLLDTYKVTDTQTRAALHQLAKDAKVRGWWAQYKDLMPEMLADFEVEACAFRTFQAQVVPGLLQTPDYAGAIFRANKVREDSEIERRIDARLKRQDVLNQVHPPTYEAVIEEGALRRVVGSAAIMHEQLLHLDHMAVRHNVDLYVLPFNAGAHPATEGSFVLLDFPDPRDSTIAYFETPVSSLYLEEDEQIRRCNTMFGSTQACSLNPVQSLALIRHICSELEE